MSGFSRTAAGHDHPAAHPESDNRPFYEWTARIQSGQYELGSTYSVILFLGPVPDNPREWEVSPNFAGSHYVLANRDGGGRGDVLVEGFIPLDRAIVKHSGLNSLDPDVVVPYLTRDLSWRVLKSNREPAKLKSLEVVVFVTPLTYPPGAMFPVPGKPHRYDSITYGREGGSRHPPSP